jgi:hypothetical protein
VDTSGKHAPTAGLGAIVEKELSKLNNMKITQEKLAVDLKTVQIKKIHEWQ